jgi:thiamine-phosphate pyrophosphorylase
MTGAAPARGAELPRLHVITNDGLARRPGIAALAAQAAAAGPLALHARAPGLGGRACWALALALRDAARETAALVFVNDRLDVARATGAAGLQLPAGGLPPAAARALLPPGVLIGRSAHDPGAARAAHADGADYVVLGPIWETTSHPGRAGLGLEAIGRAAPARVIAIGGITNPERARACRAAGAYGIAVIRAVWEDPDPGGAARRMLLCLA